MNGSTREMGSPGLLRRHPWILNAAFTALLLVAGLLDISSATSSEDFDRLATAYLVLTAAAVVAVWLRHRWPVSLLLVLMVVAPLVRFAVSGSLENPPLELLVAEGTQAEVDAAFEEYMAAHRLPMGPGVAGLILLGSVATHRRARTVWTVAALLALSRVVVALVWVRTPDLPYALVPRLTLDLVVVLMGLNVRARRQRVDALAERNRQLSLERDMREQLAVTAERTRIAREMHDVAAHSLSVMVTLAEGASAMMTRRPDQARTALDELARVGRASLADTRRLVGVLREGPDVAPDTSRPLPGAPPGAGAADGESGSLAPQPRAQDLDDLVERFRGAGLPVRYTYAGPPLPHDALLHLAVYRIVQEGLTNVLRHAPGSPGIEVSVLHVPGTVTIVVDNDTGSRPATMIGSRRGLIGIRERAAAYSGEVEAGPSATGWHLRVHLHTDQGER